MVDAEQPLTVGQVCSNSGSASVSRPANARLFRLARGVRMVVAEHLLATGGKALPVLDRAGDKASASRLFRTCHSTGWGSGVQIASGAVVSTAAALTRSD